MSVVLSQTQLLQKEVFLVEMLDSGAETIMTHLKAICFLRPTPENVQLLKRQLTNPRFGEYHVCKFYARSHSSMFRDCTDLSDYVLYTRGV